MAGRVLPCGRPAYAAFRHLLYDVLHHQFCRYEFHLCPDQLLSHCYQFPAAHAACFICGNNVFLNLLGKACQHLRPHPRLSCSPGIRPDCDLFLLQPQVFCQFLHGFKQGHLSFGLDRDFCGWPEQLFPGVQQCLDHVFDLDILFLDNPLFFFQQLLLLFNQKAERCQFFLLRHSWIPPSFFWFNYTIFRVFPPLLNTWRRPEKCRFFRDSGPVFRQFSGVKSRCFRRTFLLAGVLFSVRFRDPGGATPPAGTRFP